MSLDVYIEAPASCHEGSGIFVRANGRTKEISRKEWDKKFPNQEPIIADTGCEPYHNGNITHNLNTMAEAAGLYQYLWRPDELGIDAASELIKPLEDGLKRLQASPEKFKKYNPPNGWGDYDGLVQFVAEYLSACKAQPNGVIRVWR